MNAEDPVFSVVIPTFNRPKALVRCLIALFGQRFSQRFEIIVVNDGGVDLPPFPHDLPENITLRFLSQQNRGPATARNFGAATARGTYLAFTDDDCEPGPEWLSSLYVTLISAHHTLAGGHTINALTKNLYSESSQLLIDFLYEFYVDSGAPRFFTSNNFALQRQAYTNIGGFSERFPLAAAEDREFCSRWRAGGGRMTHSPNAVVYHFHHLSLKSFLNQHFRYGRGAWQFRKNPTAIPPQETRIEPVRFYLDLILYPLQQKKTLSFLARIQCLLLLLAAQAVNAVGFFFEAARFMAK